MTHEVVSRGRSEVDATRARLGVPGIAWVVVADGEVLEQGGTGKADLDAGLDMTAQMALPIASISKTATALITMRLAQDGKLDLDAPVNESLARLTLRSPRGVPAVTARHLLTHTGGIGLLARWRDAARPRDWTGVAARDRYVPRLRVDRTVGRRWAYSDHGYAILAAVAEELTGRRFDEILRDVVLDPFELHRAALTVDGEISAPNAVRYEDGRPLGRFVEDDVGAGGISAPVEELGRYMVGLMAGGRDVVAPAVLADMWRPHFELPGVGGMGLGFFCVDLGGLRLRGHSGNTRGASSSFYMDPGRGIGAAVMTNAYTLAMPGLVVRLLRAATSDRFAAPRNAVGAPRGVYRPLRGVRANLQPWIYQGGELSIVRAADGGEAMVGAAPVGPFASPARVASLGDGVFVAEVDEVPMVLSFSGDAVHHGGLLGFFAYRRRPAWSSYRRPVRALVGLAALVRRLGSVR